MRMIKKQQVDCAKRSKKDYGTAQLIQVHKWSKTLWCRNNFEMRIDEMRARLS